MTIDADDPRLKSVQIADAIRQDIAGGVLNPGSRLPSHAKLAERFEVATQTIQNALKPLRDEGLLRSAGNRGTFITDDAREHLAAQPDRPAGASETAELRREVAELRKRVAALEAAVDLP
ncbi:winged helix-turn-helix transcriptional regulator [Streptomyces sp. A7024]|uniref:Winged helix-turn-helix transcriptional regulator n=1 Tax=Streptomyces coryli TaxID=1128680 RepID=A0A6G4TXZ7_9ACTN|nr:winged helix-turn-helix domain-containing protein [Streptomyces coryli]NGN63871.1 winged helix-turn-helix transcriptional regulator [Streptomyces coryli]